MLIDFHTHVFPDKLAPRAMEKLAHIGKLQPFSDGTAGGLLDCMDKWGVDISVVQNIATNAKQQDNVNAFAHELNENSRLVAFGSVNPFCADPAGEVSALASRGFRGIKLHPDYVELDVDDEKCMVIFRAAAEAGLVVTIHAGYDFISPDNIHATPQRIRNVIKKIPSLLLVCAHFGANEMWDGVIEHLCGENVYFDTSLCAERIGAETAEEIIRLHGDERILFGSDMPWYPPDRSYRFIDSLNISNEAKQRIFYKNAQNLLGL